MADFEIGQVKAVRELTYDRLVNLHLADGWVLLLVREGSDVDHSPVNGELETFSVTSYTLGWKGEGEPKSENELSDLLKAKVQPLDEAVF